MPGLGEGAAVPTRPAVVQRMLTMASDQKWQNVVDQQVKEYEAEEALKLEKRREIKQRMQKDILEAERYRLQRVGDARRDREENRLMVLSVMKEVEAEEKLKVVSRREKEIRERADMEEQRLEKIRRDEIRKEQLKEENAKIRSEIQEDISEYNAEVAHHKREVKGALLDFLSHSEKITRERKEQKARELAEQKEHDRRNASKLSASERNAALSEKQYRMQMDMVKMRQDRQDSAGQVFLEQEERNAMERAAVARRTETAMEKRNREREDRNQRDLEQKRVMRSKLVASLDEEIRVREERNREVESGKSVLRKRVDDDTLSFEQERVEAAAKERQKQLKLCKELDNQVKDRFQQKLKPGKIKITERMVR